MELFKYLYTCTKAFQEHKEEIAYYIYPTDVTINRVHYPYVTDMGVLLSEEYKEAHFKQYKSIWDIDDK